MLIDTHAHLDFRQYDTDRKEVIQRSRNDGISVIINIGVDLETSIASVNLAKEYDGLFAAIGFHPHEAKHLNTIALTKIKALSAEGKVVAIGEIGLDYYRDYAPRDIQRDVFRRQLRLAGSLDLPVVVHIRQAYDDAKSILAEECESGARGVLHCYSGDEKMAEWAVELGFHLSFTGVVTFPKNTALDIAASIPLESLLLETDCPFLAPVPYRGKRNEPGYVRIIAEQIARARGISLEKLAEATTRNARQLFKLPV